MDERLNKLEEEIALIKQRNINVEADKAWETSAFRIIGIGIITYIIASLVLYLIKNNNYFLNALIPTIGYLLSVQSLPSIKKWWINHRLKKQ